MQTLTEPGKGKKTNEGRWETGGTFITAWEHMELQKKQCIGRVRSCQKLLQEKKKAPPGYPIFLWQDVGKRGKLIGQKIKMFNPEGKPNKRESELQFNISELGRKY